MEALGKLEQTILRWIKDIPHLPSGTQKWLAQNIWWLVAIGAVLSVVAVGMTLSLLTVTPLIGAATALYYSTSAVTGWNMITGLVSLAFIVLETILLFLAIGPLRALQKKGWVLLFAYWLLSAVAIVVNAVLALNVIVLVQNLLFGAVWLAISGYFLFEIHSRFAHVEKSAGVRAHDLPHDTTTHTL